MENMDDLLKNYVLPWARQNMQPVKDVIFRCFRHIEQNEGLLSRYNTLLAAKGATPETRRQVNREIALRIKKGLGLESAKRRVYLPRGKYLINSYTMLQK